ncbi:MAG: hypothetical protein JEZ06_14685 [Anaerolineaceae bacterium]|nr:hypothetical protein [Anaerolineaceae bacterium]
MFATTIPGKLTLPLVALPFDKNPAAIYLAGLGESSRRTQKQALDSITKLMTKDELDALAFPWHNLRFQHSTVKGKVQLYFGLQIGDDTGVYLEGELMGQNCGLKISLPDMGFYSSAGDIGVTANIHQSHWVLTTERSIYKYGGYHSFGKRFYGKGLSSYVYDEDFDRGKLLNRWDSGMNLLYELEEKP